MGDERADARVPALDGMRGWLALLVMVAHALEVLFPALSAAGPEHLGVEGALRWTPVNTLLADDLAVRIFFVHSGFVMALRFVRTGDRRWPAAMAVRRPIRLELPILAATLAVFALTLAIPQRVAEMRAATGAFIHEQDGSFGQVLVDATIGNLLWAGGSVPGAWWTMPVELYCSLALLACLVVWPSIPARARPAVIVAYLLGTLAWAVQRTSAPWADFTTFDDAVALLVLLFVAFVLGALLSAAWTHRPAWFRRGGLPTAGWWIVGVGALVAGTYPSILRRIVGEGTELQLGVIVAAAVLMATVLRSPVLQRWFERPGSRWLGRISFALYLVHIGVQRTVMDASFLDLLDRSVPYGAAAAAALVVSSACALGLAHLLTRGVEGTALTLGKEPIERAFGLRRDGEG